MQNKIALSIGFLSMLVASGCGVTSRYVTAEHWHDDNSFFIAYTEFTKTNYIVYTTGKSSAHVMMCRVQPDNKADCRPQVAIDRLLNPNEKIADPPPASEPAPATAPEGEPQS